MLIDKQLHVELLAEADKQLSSVRQDLKRSNATLEVVAARIKTSCWQGMKVKGERVAGIQDPSTCVANYPMCSVCATQDKLLWCRCIA